MSLLTNNHLKSTVALAYLQSVTDPEIGLNIVDLGLVYELNFNEAEKLIRCVMTLTTQFCPMGESITTDARETLKTGFPEYAVELELTFDPPWNHEMISAEGREFLNER